MIVVEDVAVEVGEPMFICPDAGLMNFLKNCTVQDVGLSKVYSVAMIVVAAVEDNVVLDGLVVKLTPTGGT